MSRSKLCWRQPLLALALGCLVAVSSESNAQVFATLRLVAEDQTTDPQIYDGAFDVYHLVADNLFAEVPGFRLDLRGENLIQSSFADDFVRTTTDFGVFGDFVFVDSFLVANQDGDIFGDPLTGGPLVGSLDVVSTTERLSGAVAAAGGLAMPAGNNEVIAVVAVAAGSPRPNLLESSGVAYVIGDGPSDVFDNGDGIIDLLDLDAAGSLGDEAFVATFHAFGLVTVGGPVEVAVDPVEIVFRAELAGGFNFDGVVDLLDLDILGRNFNQPGGFRDGDANGDGRVDLLDLDGFTFTGDGSAAAVPEPTTLALLAIAALGGFAHRRQ